MEINDAKHQNTDTHTHTHTHTHTLCLCIFACEHLGGGEGAEVGLFSVDSSGPPISSGPPWGGRCPGGEGHVLKSQRSKISFKNKKEEEQKGRCCTPAPWHLFLPCSRWSWRWRRPQTEWVQSCIPGTRRRGCRCRGSAGGEEFKPSRGFSRRSGERKDSEGEVSGVERGERRFGTDPTRWMITSRTSTQPFRDSTSNRASMAVPTLSKLKLRGLALREGGVDASVTGRKTSPN